MATNRYQLILENAGADSHAPEGTPARDLATIANSLQLAHDQVTRLASELAALSRLQDADELRRRAGWAAADAEEAAALLAPVQS